MAAENIHSTQHMECFCSEHVALPFTDLPASDGFLLALSDEDLKELSDHIISGRVTKRNLCKSCLGG